MSNFFAINYITISLIFFAFEKLILRRVEQKH